MNLFSKYISCIGVFLIGTLAFAQTKKPQNDTLSTESVTVIKTFNPTINDAFKIHPTPNFDEDSSTEKAPLNFKINSVPVASTFVPQKSKSVGVKRERRPEMFNNYVSLGAGNLGSALAEAFTSIDINRDSQFTALLQHHSSQGGIKDVRLDDHFYDTGLQLTYGKQQKNAYWLLDFEAQHGQYNWYGISEDLPITEAQLVSVDPTHNFIDVNLGGEFNIDNKFFNSVTTRFRHFRDDYDSAENNFNLKPKFTIPLEDTSILFPVELDFVGGKFAESQAFSEINYSILNLGVSPSVALTFNDIDVKLGFSGYVSSNFEASKTKFYAYPNVTAFYNFLDYGVSVFGGITGGLQQNTYHNAAAENPFVAPQLGITPTSKTFDAELGVRGQWNGKVGYQLKGSFASEKDKALWLKNPVFISDEIINFGFNNSFGYVYDDVTTAKAEGELSYEEEGIFGVKLQASFASFGTDDQQEAWNLSSLQTNLKANYFISPQLNISGNVFYVGQRKGFDHLNSAIKNLDSYVDLNLRADYQITKNWSAFVMGNNLTAQNYERWQDFPVQGIQLLVGAKYKFKLR